LECSAGGDTCREVGHQIRDLFGGGPEQDVASLEQMDLGVGRVFTDAKRW
jgi:hypothetical protein